MDSDLCAAILEDALHRYGVPEIFNTDQGLQFASYDFIKALSDAEARFSAVYRGPWLDNEMIERSWRSLKCERLYLRDYETCSELHRALSW